VRVARSRYRRRFLTLLVGAIASMAAQQGGPAYLVPDGLADGILLNVPQRRLFVMREGIAAASYPVGLGRPGWPTFEGRFEIAAKEIDPVWDVPLSIQEEMRRAGKAVVTRVLPGPANPLGKYWLGLSVPGFGIHGTNAPRSISRFESHGCIRLHAADIHDLFARVEVGTPGRSIYQPVVLGTIDQTVWLEAHPDVYRRAHHDPLDEALAAAARLAPDLVIDHRRVAQLLRERDGRPHRIDIPDDPVGPRLVSAARTQ
jgi:L,D-transpeptidase ErfK/SrfK